MTAASRLRRRPASVASMQGLSLFDDVPAAGLRRLAAPSTHESFRAGEVVLVEDEAGGDVLVVLSGRLEVLAPGGGERLAWVGPGQVVGERALLDGGRRCATVRAARDSELVRIPGPELERVFLRHPFVLRRLSATVADRVRVRATAPSPGATSIAVVPTRGTERWRVAQLCEALAKELGGDGVATVLDQPTATASFDAIEAAHRFVVYQTAGPRAAWTRRCTRQADVVLLVGESTADPAPSPEESTLLRSGLRPGVRTHLVLLHPTDAVVAGTAHWLAPRAVDGWFHVTSDGRSLERLARHVRGEAVTLVLGGGGARGFAHLGVLRALEAGNVPIDAVGGTSIGAIMGAFAALGWDDARRISTAKSGFVDTRRLVGYTLPVLSLSSSKKLTRLLQHHTGDTAIEDLPIPFFCVSANYGTGEPVIHDRGPLWWALRASISLPGILPPVYSGGDLLVDGGVVNNLPVDVMRSRHDGTVVAVDLRSRPAERTIPSFEPTLSGWHVLAQRLNPRRRSLRLPGPAATVLRAKELGAKESHRHRRAAADLLLEPPVGGVDSMDFRAGLPLVDVAHSYTLDRLAGTQLLWNHAHA